MVYSCRRAALSDGPVNDGGKHQYLHSPRQLHAKAWAEPLESDTHFIAMAGILAG